MSITPEHRLGEPQKPRIFIDREDHIETFKQAISSLPLTDNKVINYHGVGGIGKTALRQELCRLLDEEYQNALWAVVDFAIATNRDAENALFTLRRDLNRAYNVQFPSFDNPW